MGHLSFCYHHIDPTKIIVSIGDFDGRPRQFMVRGNVPDPASVSRATGRVKYELVQPSIDGAGRVMDNRNPPGFGVVMVEIIEGGKLRVEVFPGRRVDSVSHFTDAALIYER